MNHLTGDNAPLRETGRSKEREEFLSDVLVCIVEDGCYNQWRRIGAYKWEGRNHHDYYAKIIDVEDDEKEFDLTIEVVAKGINQICNDNNFNINSGLRESIKRANNENDAGEIDAELADCILQAALFGELTYG